MVSTPKVSDTPIDRMLNDVHTETVTLPAGIPPVSSFQGHDYVDPGLWKYLLLYGAESLGWTFLVLIVLVVIYWLYYRFYECPDDGKNLPQVTVKMEAKGDVLPFQGDLKVCTFNILAEIWEGSGDEAERNPKILKTIREIAPDVLLLQEAQDTSVNFILEGLNDPKMSEFHAHGAYREVNFASHDHRCWDDWLGDRKWRPNGQAILVKEHLVKHIVRVETLNISEGDDPAFNLPAFTVKMQSSPNAESKNVCLVNVHLWYGNNGGKRKQQLNMIKRWLDSQKEAGKIDHVLIAGDFNDITGTLLREQEGEFRNHGNDHGLQAVDTCANGYFSLRIDHIISSPELVSIDCITPYEMPETGFGWGVFGGSVNSDVQYFTKGISKKALVAKYGTDHLPVTSTVRLRSGNVSC